MEIYRMKKQVYNIDGKKSKEIELPGFFSEKVREDLISKLLETRKTKQPYGPSPVAGRQHSASKISNKRRHVWKATYGRGISRVPRKIMTNRGSQFHWIGAEVSGTVGGRRAHPPKSWSNFSGGKLNKKERRLALISALSATADSKYVSKKYSSLEDKKIEVPFIVEKEFVKLKAKEFHKGLKQILADLYDIAIQKKSIRAGKGKRRGRKYKKNAGMLFVVGKNETPKLNNIEIKKAGTVSVKDLAKGGPGRLTVYTDLAIHELNERILGEKK